MNNISRGLAVASVVVALSGGAANAALVNGLGVGGWVSNDTRPAGGGAATPAQIAAQIKFLSEGQVAADAAGGTPDASPAGSLGGQGYVRLDGTSANAGKSDISYFDDMGPASQLVDPSFQLAYRQFSDPNLSPRTVGLNIAVFDGVNAYTFVYVDPAVVADTWVTSNVDRSSQFYLYGLGAPGGGGGTKTLLEWEQDPTWGSLLDADNTITRIGFNIGSYQRNALVYLDWMETNLLQGGAIQDFVSADVVPEPGTMALVAAALAALGWRRRMSSGEGRP